MLAQDCQQQSGDSLVRTCQKSNSCVARTAITTSSTANLQYTSLLLVSVSVYFKQHLKLEIGGPAWGTIPYQITILCQQESHSTVVVAQR